MIADGASHGQDIAQIRRPIFVGRRAHGDQLEQPMIDAFFGVGGEAQAPGRGAAPDQRFEPGLMDRYLAALEHGRFALIDIHAQHVIACVRQACARDQAHVA